jgi:hypothetical protein
MHRPAILTISRVPSQIKRGALKIGSKQTLYSKTPEEPATHSR